VTPDVSVLTPVLNEEAGLRKVVAAMRAQEFDGEVEFLFIDGGSEDRSVRILTEIAAEDPRVKILSNPARRTPQALNVGFRAARGEFVARMDAHAIYPPCYLAAGVRRLRRGDVDWVSGPQLAVGTDSGSARVARALTVALGKGGARFRDDLRLEREVDSGFTGIWRRETLLRHHGWDEEWLNDQDLELAARIRSAGGRIVCIPEMAAEYAPRGTLTRLARQYQTYGLYRVKTARRHPETLRRSQLLPPALTVATGLALIGPTREVRLVSRAGLGAYAGILLAGGVRGAREGEPSDVIGLPAVWTTMHLSYGVGFLRGCLRFGPPVAAARRLISGLCRRGLSVGAAAPASRGGSGDGRRPDPRSVHGGPARSRLGPWLPLVTDR
jgi:succinoglycan biosynthesis protein ExoA